MQGRIVDLFRYGAISGERNFIKLIKASIFLEVVLAIDIIKSPHPI